MVVALAAAVWPRCFVTAGLVAVLGATLLLTQLSEPQSGRAVATRPWSPRVSAATVKELPAALQAAASAVWGEGRREYRLAAVTGGFQGFNPVQRLHLNSAPLGVVAEADGGARLG
jgi:hypothetical protein